MQFWCRRYPQLLHTDRKASWFSSSPFSCVSSIKIVKKRRVWSNWRRGAQGRYRRSDLTQRVVLGRKNATPSSGEKPATKTGRQRPRRQHDGDIVPNGIYPPALATLKALPFVLEHQGLFAHRADQD